MREHHFMCKICEIKYDDEYDLLAHCESHQKEDGTFVFNYEGCTNKKKKISDVCFFCAQNIHHGVKYFKCEHCKKPFTFLDSLVSHISSHKRGKHFICPMCKVSYTSLPRIRAHFKEQHNKTCNF